MEYDVVVIGGGPAGIAAVTTAARQGLNCAVLSVSLGGQLKSASAISNWPTQENISGSELSSQLTRQLNDDKLGVTVKQPAALKEIRKLEESDGLPNYSVITKADEVFRAKSLILAMGTSHKILNLPGEHKLTGKGLSYCAVCDAPYYKSKDVAVIGDDSKAKSAVLGLSRIASKVYLLQREKSSSLQPSNVEILKGVRPVAILGHDRVSGISYRENDTEELKEIVVDGVFIEAGTVPNSEPVKNLVKTDDVGQIIVDHRTMAASAPGIFAAGDITDSRYKQVTAAIAGGVAAALSAADYVINNERKE